MVPSATSVQTAVPSAAPLRIPAERVRCALLWLTGLAGAFVFIEPSPYELVALLTVVVFAVTGLTLSASVLPLLTLLLLLNIGFSIAVVPVLTEPRAVTWVLVSWYLAITAIFFAAALSHNTERRLAMLVRGYGMAAIVAAVAGIIGYFQLIPGLSGLFTKFGRAQGTFNDPNVLGAFLIFPALVALQRILTGRNGAALRGAAMFALLTIAVLLSFSRAAWGQLAGCTMLLLLLTFLTTRSDRERLRIIALAVVGCVVTSALIVAILSIDQVADLFQERASLSQSYDSGPTGRFGRYQEGFLMVLSRPLGIGPLQFAKYLPEDPHNSYLNVFVSGGWLGGISYAALVVMTLGLGFRYIFVPTPWRSIYLAAYVAYFGVAVESSIIDTDHWRHYFLLLGMVWALMIASARHERRPPGSPHAALASARDPA